MLSRVADEPERRTGFDREITEAEQVPVADRRCFVDDQHRPRIEDTDAGVGSAEQHRDRLGLDPASSASWRPASPFTAAPSTRYPAAVHAPAAARIVVVLPVPADRRRIAHDHRWSAMPRTRSACSPLSRSADTIAASMSSRVDRCPKPVSRPVSTVDTMRCWTPRSSIVVNVGSACPSVIDRAVASRIARGVVDLDDQTRSRRTEPSAVPPRGAARAPSAGAVGVEDRPVRDRSHHVARPNVFDVAHSAVGRVDQVGEQSRLQGQSGGASNAIARSARSKHEAMSRPTRSALVNHSARSSIGSTACLSERVFNRHMIFLAIRDRATKALFERPADLVHLGATLGELADAASSTPAISHTPSLRRHQPRPRSRSLPPDRSAWRALLPAGAWRYERSGIESADAAFVVDDRVGDDVVDDADAGRALRLVPWR